VRAIENTAAAVGAGIVQNESTNVALRRTAAEHGYIPEDAQAFGRALGSVTLPLKDAAQACGLRTIQRDEIVNLVKATYRELLRPIVQPYESVDWYMNRLQVRATDAELTVRVPWNVLGSSRERVERALSAVAPAALLRRDRMGGAATLTQTILDTIEWTPRTGIGTRTAQEMPRRVES
jgi:hypothetical protein